MIGVFGDSFADINPAQYIDEDLNRMPWPLWLEKLSSTKVECHSISASSTWYSYKKFIDNYKKYEKIIFCYSDLHRWHNINSDEGLHIGLHHIRYQEQLKLVSPEFKDTARILIDAYRVLHDWDFDKFVFQSIFNSVNELCDNAGITIVNILNFEEINNIPLSIDINTTDNVVLTNLVKVSGNEYLNKDDTPKDKSIHKFITENHDKRFCHLSPTNNRVLAEILNELPFGNTRYINLGLDDRFSRDVNELRYLLELS